MAFGVLAAAVVLAWPAGAQITVRTSTIFESYNFGAGILIDRVSELTIPVVVTVPMGRARATISGGYASVTLSSANTDDLADQSLSGALDTEVRLTYDVIPGRLVAIAAGAIPSGSKTVAPDELAILGALSSDIIGFSAANLGSGGNFGGGFAGALPLGRFALGYGATFRQSVSYVPINGVSEELSPGSELRIRAGLEGPLARRTYLRVASVYAARAKDQINGAPRNGIGNRAIVYAAVNQGLGGTQLTLYGFDVYRADPQIEPTATGAAVFPRGNLIAMGARLQFGSRTSVTPRVEYRISAIAQDETDTVLRRAGQTVRAGADVRTPLGTRAGLLFFGSYLTGNVVQAGENVSLNGFRAGVTLELRP